MQTHSVNLCIGRDSVCMLRERERERELAVVALVPNHGVCVSISREIGSRLVRVVERAREAALFFAPSSSARRVSLSLVVSCLSLLLSIACFVSQSLVYLAYLS